MACPPIGLLLWLAWKVSENRRPVKALTLCFEALAGGPLVPGIIFAVQTFGDRISFHPHLLLLVTEGGMGLAGVFHRQPHLDDSRLAEKPRPTYAFEQVDLMAAEKSGEYD
jgi:hypothetical protein